MCSDESRPPLLEVTSLDSGSNIPQCTPDKHPFSLMCSNVLHEPCAPLQLEVTSLDRYGDLASQVPVEFLSNTPLSTPDKNESTGSLMCSDVLPESRPPQLEVISLGKYSDLHSLVPIELGLTLHHVLLLDSQDPRTSCQSLILIIKHHRHYSFHCLFHFSVIVQYKHQLTWYLVLKSMQFLFFLHAREV